MIRQQIKIPNISKICEISNTKPHTIKNVKKKIQNKEDIPKEQILLVYTKDSGKEE